MMEASIFWESGCVLTTTFFMIQRKFLETQLIWD